MLLYSTAETSGSEVLLKTKKLAYIPDSSDVRAINASIEIYNRISPNEYLFITTKPTNVAIICENSPNKV
jgi:hypothetical protein